MTRMLIQANKLTFNMGEDNERQVGPALSVFRYDPQRAANKPGSPLDHVPCERRVTELTHPKKGIIFSNRETGGFKVPTFWSTLAGDIAAEKYARKAGCTVLADGREDSAVQIVRRITQKITDWGLEQGYFLTAENARNFMYELQDLLIHQYGAFNSPVNFNVGLDLYGCTGSGGNYYWEPKGQTLYRRGDHGEDIQGLPCAVRTQDAYSRPQSSACFILKRSDDLDAIYQGRLS